MMCRKLTWLVSLVLLLGLGHSASAQWKASNPIPSNGAVDVDVALLKWTAGETALTHTVYLSTDTTIDGLDLIAETVGTSQVVNLDPGTTYYWRVDENDLNEVVIEGNVWSFSTLPLEAHFPNPADGAEGIEPTVTLSWTVGKNTIMNDVYFGTDEVAVAAGDPNTFKGKLMVASYNPGELDLFTTYYWKVDEFTPTGTVSGPVWSFTTRPENAKNPNPPDGAINVPLDIDLSWKPGTGATSQDVYFGTSGSLAFIGNQTESSFDPGTLNPDTNYSWRIDTVIQIGEFFMVYPGDPWSFTTRATVTEVNGWQIWNVRLNGGGTSLTVDPGDPVDLYYAFEVWNGTDVPGAIRQVLAGLVKGPWSQVIDVCAYDGIPAVGPTKTSGSFYGTFNAPTEPGTYQLVVAMDAQYTCDDAKNRFPEQADQGWTEVVATITVKSEPEIPKAVDPYPDDGAEGVPTDVILSWGFSHDEDDELYDPVWHVYFSDDFDAVANADTSDTTGIYRGPQALDDNSHYPGSLEWNTNYFWRIDGAKDLNDVPDTWNGDIWSFTTGLDPDEKADFEFFFYQMDFNLSGTAYIDTEWGSVDFTFAGQEPIMYFNLTVNGTWQVQNIPVLSIEGVGVEQTMTYYFDLGTARGTNVTSLNYDYAFTPDILDTPPGVLEPAPVVDGYVAMWPGFGGLMPPLAPAGPLIGGESKKPKKYAHKNFPNQECGPLECTPTAVSNSLQFLNKRHALGMDPNKITIDEMKKAVGFTEGWGCSPNTWWELKKKYMEDNDYPITTRKTTDMNELPGEIARGQDVELGVPLHCAAIVGITDLGGGKFSIDVAHDTEQGQPGGTKTETITYDPNTNKFTGSPGFFDGASFVNAVVECPYILLDDFEFYDDDIGNRIFETWIDGLGYTYPLPGHPSNRTGAIVGNSEAPIAEQTIVYEGSQSMPFSYDNSGSNRKAPYSETKRTWDVAQDWTRYGVKAMSLWFYGDPNNNAEQMYVAVEDITGMSAVVVHEDTDATLIETWQRWTICLEEFTDQGVNLTGISKMYIGFGNRDDPTPGGTGTVYFDDILLNVPPETQDTSDANDLAELLDHLEKIRKALKDVKGDLEENTFVKEIRLIETIRKILSNLDTLDETAIDALEAFLSCDKNALNNLNADDLDKLLELLEGVLKLIKITWTDLQPNQKAVLEKIIEQIEKVRNGLADVQKIKEITSDDWNVWEELADALNDKLKEAIEDAALEALEEYVGKKLAGAILSIIKDLVDFADLLSGISEMQDLERAWNTIMLKVIEKADGMKAYSIPRGSDWYNSHFWVFSCEMYTGAQFTLEPHMRCWHPTLGGEPGEGEWTECPISFTNEGKTTYKDVEGAGSVTFGKGEMDCNKYWFTLKWDNQESGCSPPCYITLTVTITHPSGKVESSTFLVAVIN